jgi:hypothetical protein
LSLVWTQPPSAQAAAMMTMADSLASQARVHHRKIGQLELAAKAYGYGMLELSKEIFKDWARPKASRRLH